MKRKFDIVFLEACMDFLKNLDEATREKIIYNIDKASHVNDPALFKKLNDHIWEFRTFFKKTQYRILAFWDKDDKTETWVLATHGFIKKSQKIPKSEIKQAEKIRKAYFDEKNHA